MAFSIPKDFMNPWKENILNLLRNILRFSLWIFLVVNGLMLGVFSVIWTYHFLVHTWSYFARAWFAESW